MYSWKATILAEQFKQNCKHLGKINISKGQYYSSYVFIKIRWGSKKGY